MKKNYYNLRMISSNFIAALRKYIIKKLVLILTSTFMIIDFLLSSMIFLKILIFGGCLGGELQLSRISRKIN